MFSSRSFLPDAVMARITETRIADPDYPLRQAEVRIRRDRLAPAGKLNILAADHPARRVTAVGGDRLAMADRQDYLARILRILMADAVDGVMATMDILEDLLSIDGFIRERGGRPMLDEKLLIASLNRAGLAGSAWELEDPISGPSPQAVAAWRLDGAKILLRIADTDAGSLKTILASAAAIDLANALRLPTFLEPLPVQKTERGWAVEKSAEALARIAGVASALGDSSRYLWLKLPYCPDYQIVARSTSLPILLLGGESAGDPVPFLNELSGGLAAGANVRGALVGRNVFYPGEEDPLAMAAAVGGIIHEDWPVDRALESMAATRGRDLDRVACYFSYRMEERDGDTPGNHGPGPAGLSEESICRARRHGAAVLRRCVGHLRARQRRRHRPGAAGESRLSAITCAAMSRRWSTSPRRSPSTKPAARRSPALPRSGPARPT